MSDMQQALNALYTEAHAAMRGAFSTTQGLSEPLFVSVPPAYERAPIRLVIVGQQTCSWHGQFGTQDVAGLVHAYHAFDLGHHGPYSPFRDDVHRLQRTLSPGVPDRGFVWANVVPCDQHERRPEPEVLERLLQFQLLRQEVRILKPHAVVFFTGPSCDSALRRMFDGVRLEPVSGFVPRLLSRVVHPDLPAPAYRTFHPKYLRLKGLDVLPAIAERVREMMDMGIPHPA